MGYLEDLKYMRTLKGATRMQAFQQTVWGKDFDTAIEVLRHSPSANKAQLMHMAQECVKYDLFKENSK